MEPPSSISLFETPLALADVSGRIVELSAGFATWFPQARVGSNLGALLPAGTLGHGEDALVERTVLTTRAGKTPVELRIRRHRDLWWVEGRDLGGEKRRDDMLAFYDQVTRQSNRALSAERNAALELLKALARPVFSVDETGAPTSFATPECAEFFGCEPRRVDFPALLARDLPPADGVALRSAYRATFGESLSVFDELRSLLPDVVRSPRAAGPALALESHPVLNDAGAVVRIVHELRPVSASAGSSPALGRLEAKLDALLADKHSLLQPVGF